MRGFRRILVALDGSKHVLQPGLQLAGDEGCWTTVLKVMPETEGDLELTGIKNIDSVLAGGEQQTRAEVRRTADEARVLVKARIEEGGIPERIVAVAAEERCDLIVIGRERLPWYRRLLGRASRSVWRARLGVPCSSFDGGRGTTGKVRDLTRDRIVVELPGGRVRIEDAPGGGGASLAKSACASTPTSCAPGEAIAAAARRRGRP